MDALARPAHHALVRVLPHVNKLDDALGDFIVRVTCPCGVSRHIHPEVLARLVGGKVTLAALATRMRCDAMGRWVTSLLPQHPGDLILAPRLAGERKVDPMVFPIRQGVFHGPLRFREAMEIGR